MYEQLDIFDMTRPPFQIDRPIRLIELFAGVGSQAMALRDLVADFEHYRVVEFDRFAVSSYNAIHGTDFETTDIRNISGADLGINNTDKYCYIMTYSFPCQDLSVAGKQKGMAKGSGTRSGLLWEAERLMNECSELPQVLLMENVPQVHSKANMPDFQKWIDFLASKGYSNYWQDLNAKDYGVAQNRDRCFMVSILGEWNYKFPQPIPLEGKLRDYLEDEVDEKYYINNEKSQKLIQTLIDNGTFRNDCDFEMDGNFNQRGKVHREESVCRTIMGSGHTGNEPKVFVDLSLNNSGGMGERRLGNIYGFDGGNYAGNVYDEKALSPTIRTYQGNNREPMIVRSVGRNPDNPSDRTAGIPTEQRLEPNSLGICNTLTSVQKDNMVLENVPISYGMKICAKTINVGMCVTARYHKGFSNYNPENAVINNYMIRKLTPLECWRLMGFSDEDFHKAEGVNSNSQLYKQAGNGIVKNVLMAIFGQMIPKRENFYKEL